MARIREDEEPLEFRWFVPKMRQPDQLPKRSPLAGAAPVLLGAAWKSGVLRRPVFDPDALMERAREITGLRDFGDPWFERPLRVLARAVEEEADLNALGRFGAYGQLVKLLRDRLWTQHWFKEHPEILARPVLPPVVVVGPMRSGTTRLHRLLAADDRFSHIRFFETVSPVFSPNSGRGRKDPRPIEAGRILSAVRLANPRTAIIHPTSLHSPEEELGLLVASAWGMKHEAQWSIPSYGAWSARQDATPAYRHLAKMLRLIEWLRGDEEPKPWVLKTPQHMINLSALLNVFPDARIVFIHRDPAEVVGSTCSLVWNQMIIHSDRVDPLVIGERWLAKTEQQIDAMWRTRAQMAPGRSIDETYDEMERDRRSVMARIYGFLDVDMSPAQPAMEIYARAAQARRSIHRYDPRHYGLDSGEIRERFSSYINSFAVPASDGRDGRATRKTPAGGKRRGIQHAEELRRMSVARGPELTPGSPS